MMTPRTTGGVISSRYFHARELKRALSVLPSSQRKYIRALAARLNDQTGIGYYSALDFIATMGVYFTEERGPGSHKSS
jgi:hypothetical protein